MNTRRTLAVWSITICMFCLVHVDGSAQECDAYEEYIHLVGDADVNGVAYDIALWNDLAYLADPFLWALYIMDVMDPQNPVLVNTVELEVYPQAIAIEAGSLYLATNTGLAVMTLTDPIAPQLQGFLPLASASVDVVLAGPYAYVAELTTGLQVVDISDPSAPELRHTVASTPRQIALQGGHAYLAAGGAGMQVVDISTPESAGIVGSVSLPGTATGIAVLGDHAYVAVGDEGLQAVDVTNPSLPAVAGSLDLPQPITGVDIAPTSAPAFAIVFGGDGGPFATVDLTLPAQPDLLAYFGGDGYTAAFQDDLAYIANSGWGLAIYDVSNPAAREPLYSDVVAPSGQDIAAGDNLLYIASSFGSEGQLRVYSLTDPYQPQLEGTVPLAYRSEKVEGAGSFALVYGDTWESGAQVLLVDANDPTMPQVVNTWEFESFVRGIVVEDDLAYVLHDLDPPVDQFHSRLQILDIADPLSPVLRGAVALPAALGLAVEGPRGAVTCNFTPGWDYDIPLVMLDLADPDAPAIHALTGYSHVTERVAINGYLIVVGEQEGPLPISRRDYSLDFFLYPYPGSSDNPVVEQLGSGSMLSPASELIVTSSHVFSSGQVFDFSAHAQTFSMGGTYDMGPARILTGGLIYAVSAGSFSVYPTQCEFVVAIEGEDTGEQPDGLPAWPGVLSVHPNPFNPRTDITFQLETACRVRVAVYDLTGRLVRRLSDQLFPVGEHRLTWDGTAEGGRVVASGAYLVHWVGGGTSCTQKILLAR